MSASSAFEPLMARRVNMQYSALTGAEFRLSPRACLDVMPGGPFAAPRNLLEALGCIDGHPESIFSDASASRKVIRSLVGDADSTGGTPGMWGDRLRSQSMDTTECADASIDSPEATYQLGAEAAAVAAMVDTLPRLSLTGMPQVGGTGGCPR